MKGQVETVRPWLPWMAGLEQGQLPQGPVEGAALLWALASLESGPWPGPGESMAGPGRAGLGRAEVEGQLCSQEVVGLLPPCGLRHHSCLGAKSDMLDFG